MPVLCPAGTSSLASGQTSLSTCTGCARGTYCPAGSPVGQTCPAQYYCPANTGDYNVFPCPPGSFSDQAGLFSASQCTNCTAGYFCPGGGSPKLPCIAGTYNSQIRGTSPTSCLPCEAGYACPSSATFEVTVLCTKGYFCPLGSDASNANPCPVGTYSDATNLVSQSGCLVCPAGYSCALASTTASLYECKIGHYCPSGTAHGQELACPAGTFSNVTMLQSAAQCRPCPPGSYCLGGGSVVSGPCSAGYFCPPQTSTATQFPCPAGTYSPATNLHDVTQCLDCSPGSYCPQASIAQIPCPAGTYTSVKNTQNSKIGNGYPYCQSCPAGYFCPLGTSTPKPCNIGSYSDKNASSCQICLKGHYCGSNSTSLLSMSTGGIAWANAGHPSGVCFNGTYCPAGMTRAPDLLRNACPPGYYCPAGTPNPVPCPAGTYNGQSGQDVLSDCVVTPGGFYSIASSVKPLGLCSPGYYCPSGSSSPTQVACPARTYNPEVGGATIQDCSMCVAGGYCPKGSAEPIVCPRGFACPTGVGNPEPCPPGTYGETTGLRRLEECSPCDGGSYCDGYGLQAPKGLCSPGFYCVLGSNTSTPHHPGVCTSGSYCPLGSAFPVACPEGTFQPVLGAGSPASCLDCTPGYYCEGSGNVHPTGTCMAGYYCTGGSKMPTQNIVPPGYFSLAGATLSTACPAGSYNHDTASSSCNLCPAGYVCPNMSTTSYISSLCPAGAYCPIGSFVPHKSVFPFPYLSSFIFVSSLFFSTLPFSSLLTPLTPTH